MLTPLPLMDAIAVQKTSDPHAFTGTVQPSWSQGRAAFGGILLGMTGATAQHAVPSDRLLRSANINFLAPVTVGPVQLEIERLREGRSVTHLQVRILQEEKVCAVTTLAYGTSRPQSLAMPATPMPTAAPPHRALDIPFLPGTTPEFLRHFEYRWTSSDLPYSGGKDVHIQGWMRPRIVCPLTSSYALVLSDAFPPPILCQSTAFVRSSSLSAHMQFVDLPLPQETENPWFFYEGSASYGGNGYSDIDARLWHENGKLVARITQVIADFSGQSRQK